MAERTNVATLQRVRDDTSDRSAVAIRQDIAAKRESISETVDKLGERIHETFDWHEYVAEYPAVALGLAAGAGFLVAGIFKRNPSPQERIFDAVADLTEDMTDRVGDVMAGVIQKKLFSGRTVKAAVTAMIVKAGVDFLKKQLAGTIGDGSGRPPLQSSAPRNSDTNVDLSRHSTVVGG
jgi:ElaB/YqjD/DUF883 family membrane-anchored ribosome-binding protein